MYSPTAAAIFLLFSTILGFTNISTGLLVSTRHVTRLIGGQLRLNCSDPSTTSLYWSRESVGSAKPVYIYFPPFGLTQTYKADGRHRVELDISSGSCDLLIERLLIEDAGTYSCRTDDGEHQEIELVIIGAKTVCTSNKSLPRVLVENDCDMEPDHMELNCSAAYRGNIPPLLEWHHSSKSDVEMERYVVNRRTSADNFVVMHYMTVKLDWKFNGSNFVCSLKDVMTRNGGIGCATRKLSVMYFFHTPPTHVITEYGDNMINVSCIANTSETCSYRWQATEVRTNNPIDIHRQTISLIPKNYDDVKCFAECRVRNKICTTQPMDLKHSFADTDGDLLIMVLLPVLLIISLAVVITVGFICFRKSGSFRDMIHKKRRRANGDLTEMQSLNPFLDSDQQASIHSPCSSSPCAAATRLGQCLESDACAAPLAFHSTKDSVQAVIGGVHDWCLHNTAPKYLRDLCLPISSFECHSHLRSAAAGDLRIPSAKTVTIGRSGFSVAGPAAWNNLSTTVTLKDYTLTFTAFKKLL